MVSVGWYRGRNVVLRAGVLQSSVLLQIFFNVSIKNLLKVITECKIFQYVDGTLLLAQHTNYSGAVCLIQWDATNTMSW